MTANRCDDLAPAFRAVKYNWTAKLECKRELRLEHLAHKRRDVPHLETIKPNLANARFRIVEKPRAKLPFDFTLYTFNFTLFQCLPRVNPEEITANEKFANRRVAARNMAVGVGHLAPLRRLPGLAPLPVARLPPPTSGIAVTTASVASRSLRPR